MGEFKLDTTGRGGLTLIEVTGRFGQPPLSVAPGGGLPGVGLPGAGFAYLPCTMAAEGDLIRHSGIAPGSDADVCGRFSWIFCGLSRLFFGDGGRGSGIMDGFPISGGMGCDILSKARSSARGRGDVVVVM